MIQRIKGTQDFIDLKLFNFFIDNAKKFLKIYNFKQISTPILEPIELFKRSLGLETDVVSKEMYTVNTEVDNDGICLRPEMTASTMRAFLNESIETIPFKVFSYGPVFRHERPQKGRYREFNQLNIEAIGTSSILQDVLFIKMLDRFFSETLKLDSYALTLNFLGCLSDRIKFRDKLYKFLSENIDKICDKCKVRKESNIMRVFDCKTESCQQLYKSGPHIADNLCAECNIEWTQLQENLQNLSVSFSYNHALVRGLDYYNKTVFEFSGTALGAQNAFCGGGRYDTLATQIGAKQDYPSIGAAVGIERVIIMLEEMKDKLILEQEPALNIIIPLEQAQKELALLLSDELQAANLCTEIFLDGESMKSMMRKANKLGAKYVIILGPDEQASRMATVKNMMTGAENKVSQKDLVKALTNGL